MVPCLHLYLLLLLVPLLIFSKAEVGGRRLLAIGELAAPVNEDSPVGLCNAYVTIPAATDDMGRIITAAAGRITKLDWLALIMF